MEEQIVTGQKTVEVVDIQFRPGQKVYYFDPAGIACKAGDRVIIDTARGAEFGICAAGNHAIPQSEVVAPLRPVLRLATEQDKRIAAENQEKEKRAFAVCQEKIEQQKLDMQLVSAEYAFDGSKVLFFFTADERVDFRELVKSLASILHTRIELRQIGVRDKARMVGGLGICGRPFCCATFLDDFQPVSIKMAKTQNLSLSPTKISGTCGRLMCCLKYEQDAYEYLIRNSPKAESFVDTVDGRGTIVEVDLLRQRVRVKMEDHPEIIGVYANEDVVVLRSGKAKKNDPPIPADLAPLSGKGGGRKKQPDEEEPIKLDAIRFRYSTETVAEEQEAAQSAQEEPAVQPEEKPGKNQRRGNRRGRDRKPKVDQPQAQPKPEQTKQPKPEQTKQEKPAAEAQAGSGTPEQGQGGKKHRRPYYRRRPKSGGTGEK